MHVANLNDTTLGGEYTWKQIRDALRTAFKGVRRIQKMENLAFYLAYPDIRKTDWAFRYGSIFNELSSEFWAYITHNEIPDCADTRAFFDRVLRLSDELRETLLSHELIEVSERGGDRWRLTDRGAGLFRQMALRRISKKEAGEKLARILAAAKEFNEDPHESHAITRIVLFGSLINSQADDIGDIDIMMGLSRKYDDMSVSEWLDNESTMLFWERPSVYERGLIRTREDSARRFLKKVTPYVSIEPFCTIDQFESKGVPMLSIFAVEPDYGYASLYMEKWEVTWFDRAEATRNRSRLAKDIDCPGIAAQLWDAPIE